MLMTLWLIRIFLTRKRVFFVRVFWFDPYCWENKYHILRNTSITGNLGYFWNFWWSIFWFIVYSVHADDATFSLKMAEFIAFVIYWHYRILVWYGKNFVQRLIEGFTFVKQFSLTTMLIVSLFVVLCLQARSVEMYDITGKVENSVGFYFRNLSVFPSTMATIGFSIYYTRIRPQPYAILKLYTTKEHINVQKQCSKYHHGQFFNEKMSFVLIKRRYGKHDCKEVNDTVHCSGTTVIQDYLQELLILFGI